MQFTAETTANGVTERLFDLDGIPGALWTPVDATGSRPLVLLGHAGGQHKKAPGTLARAHSLVASRGFAVATIDAPAHGDQPKTEDDERYLADVRERAAAGEPIRPMIIRQNALLAERAVPQWRRALDALRELEPGPVGFWGLSMGTTIGLRFVAVEPRISAAVLGLAGAEALAEAAARITVPVEFLVQWDDELVPRESALALFDALASPEKTLHANTGGHVEVPLFELDSAQRFFTRHLTTGS